MKASQWWSPVNSDCKKTVRLCGLLSWANRLLRLHRPHQLL
jgi:hypothetical protein